MGFGRQIWTLTSKNLVISVQRHWLSTLIRALLAPVIYTFFIGYMKNFFVPPSEYGIGSPAPIRSFVAGLEASQGGRDTVAFVKNGFNGGQIEDLINQLVDDVHIAGKSAAVLDNEDLLLNVCRSTLRGVTNCYAAVVFHSSPTEGDVGYWNYTLRADGEFATNTFVDRKNNDQQIYILPFQHAIDRAIVNDFSNASTRIPQTINEYMFTDQTQDQLQDQIRQRYMTSVIKYLGIAYVIGIIGIVYHLTGRMAYEREIGMSQLIEAMVPSEHRWHTQAVRLIATHIAFDLIWLPGWVLMAILLKILVFTHSSYAIVIGMQLLSGLAFSSLAILGASTFHKAQLSGIVVVMITLVLAIAAQVQTPTNLTTIIIVGAIFTPANFILIIIYMARFENVGQAVNLQLAAPLSSDSTWELLGIYLWIFFIGQIAVYPVIGALIERWRFGTSSKARETFVGRKKDTTTAAITLAKFSKTYTPSWFSQHAAPLLGLDKRRPVHAVKELDLKVFPGQILCLLGANGSGKSTTMDAIAGLSKPTDGKVLVDINGGIGYCPQKNVLWDELTVYEHVTIFNRLKSLNRADIKADVGGIIETCDLGHKVNAKSKTLSGGQKRKLQLAMMLVGGSHVCCIDEVSSGVDPLSRRKIWDILLRERGKRSLLLTTHFLDEADVLADHIAIMSNGQLKAEGSAAELKQRFGGGYRIEVMRSTTPSGHVILPNEVGHVMPNDKRSTVEIYPFECADSTETTSFLEEVEKEISTDYNVGGPSIEDVFLRLCEEPHGEIHSSNALNLSGKTEARTQPIDHLAVPKQDDGTSKMSDSNGSQSTKKQPALDLMNGSSTTLIAQSWFLFKKRLTVLKRNWIPYLLALAVPIVVASLVTFFLGDDFKALSCSPTDQSSSPPTISAKDLTVGRFFLAGPRDDVPTGVIAIGLGGNLSLLQYANNYSDFQFQIEHYYQNVTPGGIFLGNSTPTMAYIGNYWAYFAPLTLNLMDQAISQQLIGFQYKQFASPFSPSVGDIFQLIFYFGLSMVAFPAFFTLYPTLERLRNIRALHYSNGVRAAPLWLAYTGFDLLFVLLVSLVVSVIWSTATPDVWYHLEYLGIVFFLYGLASTLLSYVVSLYTSSQLASFAWTAGYQATIFVLYFVAYLSILFFSPPYAIDHQIIVAHFSMALLSPSANLLRSLLLTLNVFSVLCQGQDKQIAYPGSIVAYGGPITYLLFQSMLLFLWIVWHDSGYKPEWFTSLKRRLHRHQEHIETNDQEKTVDESQRDFDLFKKSPTRTGRKGLQVKHLTKTFANLTAVEDVSFTIRSSECFALLGPNGAGKSTTISLIRGDLQPDVQCGGDVLVEGVSISRHRALARNQLGVCPQFDAMDQMTVAEHLYFYARVRGVSTPSHNVEVLVSAVGLEPFRNRIAYQLSGGNKRKLSLAIALIGNPAVLLLDEPSSGMDAVSKRFLWRTLAEVTRGRSMLITTHSMEEADRLADSVGIMATRMLALGKAEELRKRFSDKWYVQIVLEEAPHVPHQRTLAVKAWIEGRIQGVDVEERMWHGQIRFTVPVSAFSAAKLFRILEDNKQNLGLEYYSVSRATLDQVFLEVVTKHNVEEEGGASASQRQERNKAIDLLRRIWDNA